MKNRHIPFNIPPITGNEEAYMRLAIGNHKICGDGPFTQQCCQWLEAQTRTTKALLTSSCTHALEMCALLANIQAGDEVIMPSYTFVSTANAFVLRGARIVFADIRPDTMNIDESLIEAAISPETKAVVPVHYAGIGCEMDPIKDIAVKYGLLVIEDAAQGIMAEYRGKALGSIGDLGCYSFHETKNCGMGEGGALLIQSDRYVERAEIIREKGTDRSRFLRGQTDKYSWVDLGSSYLPGDLSAAFLLAQLENAGRINENRLTSYRRYEQGLADLQIQGKIDLPFIPPHCRHNAHMFYIKTRDLQERTNLIAFLKERHITAAFHYVPLHSSPAGKRYGVFRGQDKYTTRESERLVRLPMYFGLQEEDIDCVVETVYDFYRRTCL
ncbi:MAG: dTDP-4-amino-4,6-dideoxygalactose transaminase [Peptococcaceae bacterium]|nr:dTDP-4-amino-4,6-dideoxygalactose transaminase [Peptococcaceae bacterium]